MLGRERWDERAPLLNLRIGISVRTTIKIVGLHEGRTSDSWNQFQYGLIGASMSFGFSRTTDNKCLLVESP